MTSPNRLREDVLAWLNTLSPCPDPPSFAHRTSSSGINSSKRRHTESDVLQPSPKRPCRLAPPASPTMSVSPTKRSYDTHDSSSIASGSVSPKKLARNWAVRTASARQFTIREDIPASLQKTIQASVETAQTSNPEYEQDVFESFFYEQATQGAYGSRTILGPTPSVAAVLDIMDRGISCRDEQMDEAGWNQIVHSRILELAFTGLWSKNDDIIAFAPCTSAKMLPDYADPVSRKVDFCACIRPDALATIAIQSIRDQDALANQSINHTDFPPLQARPIALSIETKIHGEGMNNAETQLVTWHAAQWQSLDRLVGRAEPTMQLPDFRPGIIIQGHEWFFVASTKRGDQVTLWTSQHIGSTAKATGVYHIVCVLQYLKRWIENTYWPWSKQAVLRLSDETSTTGLVACL
ncbi:hypothetical protein CORC01_00060 [Colletotrichum orchidophilum]|uniref:PD-(D/E)XK nuclease-like domain-containing protein n=1 Tax=Colletotrichum orchidophilum TaxID=1209926 RepID=A0A1G4BT33_9PEZI|nr:uncharacterized protein CORC01_00060 [Colletotrichum orchidophilum]OHF04589.1 hypothetical protein CORC01_00060 [Colletotrichum orchidophilum]